MAENPPSDLENEPALLAALTDLLRARRGRRIAGFWPIRGEPRLLPVLAALALEGVEISLPVVVAPAAPLAFRRWQPGATMERGLFGTTHPAAGEAVTPDLVLVPLVAFDRSCRRLGRGGGFYDRTLAANPHIEAVGVAHASREVACVPAEAHDVVLDLVVTECGVTRPDRDEARA